MSQRSQQAADVEVTGAAAGSGSLIVGRLRRRRQIRARGDRWAWLRKSQAGLA